MKKYLRIIAIFTAITLVSGISCVWAEGPEYPAPFKIRNIKVANAGNFHFRVISDSPDKWHCHNGPTDEAWSYINENDNGAKGKMAILMMAFALGKTVELVTEGG